jgi:hypothetical protein
MGNCNSLRRLMGSSVDTRTSGLAEAPAEEGYYGGVPQIIRSTHSEESTFMIFENRTGGPVKLFWLNYEGHEIPYRSIEHGGSHRQQTFVTHPWTFKSCTGNPENVVVDHKRVSGMPIACCGGERERTLLTFCLVVLSSCRLYCRGENKTRESF